MKYTIISVISFVLGNAFYHFALLQESRQEHKHQGPDSQSLVPQKQSNISNHIISTEQSNTPDATTFDTSHTAISFSDEKPTTDSSVTANKSEETQKYNNEVSSNSANLAEQTNSRIYLPTAKESQQYLSEFLEAMNQFTDEDIDYDWAESMEQGFIDLITSTPQYQELSYSGFSCRKTSCVLEISDADFNKDWAPFIGEASNQFWWQVGRIHFNPYPLPATIENYTLVFERLPDSLE